MLDPRLGASRHAIGVVHRWASDLDADQSLAITCDGDWALRIVDDPASAARGRAASVDEALEAVERFAPHLVVFHAGPNTTPLFALATRLHRRGVPVTLAIETLWYESLRDTWPDRHNHQRDQVDALGRDAARVVASSPALAEELASRWGRPVERWSPSSAVTRSAKASTKSDTLLRVAAASTVEFGTGGSSLLMAAAAAHADPTTHLAVRTPAAGLGHSLSDILETFDGVDVTQIDGDSGGIEAFYAHADALLFCQDFAVGRGHTDLLGHPAALGPLLDAGRPIIAVGPAGNDAIEYLRSTGAALVVDTAEPARLNWCYDALRTQPEYRTKLGAAARRAATDRAVEQPTVGSFATRSNTPPVSDDSTFGRLRDRHLATTAVVVGNGPSLNETDLDLLDDQIVLGSNAIHLLFDRVAWRPTYYCAVDPLYLHERHEDIASLLETNPTTTGIFPARVPMHDGSARTIEPPELLGNLPNAHFVEPLGEMSATSPFGSFSTDLRAGMVQPATVTIALMQIAAHLGVDRIVLVGCDTSYTIPASAKTSGPPVPGHEDAQLIITSTDDDPNHFSPDYFGRGRTWHHPRVDNMIRHYALARDVLHMLGVDVINATAGGNLEVFPRAALADALHPTDEAS